MAEVHGVAGEWARVKGTVAGLWPLFLGVFATGIAATLIFISGLLLTGIILLTASIVFIWWSLMKGLRHVERFFKGARGEEKVAGILKDLPHEYHVFNDFLASGKHVDHVVVGPAGVFAIETKFWFGRVTLEDGHILLDGQLPGRSPLAQVRKEARAVENQLAKSFDWKGVVTPVLVFASDTFDAVIAEDGGAIILNSSHLKRSFDTHRVIIPQVELDRLVRLMENNQ